MTVYWLFVLPIVLIMEIVAVLLAPILPLFSKNAWLPDWLSWFQTPDNNLMGDEGHQARWLKHSPYMQMVAWLVRNRAYGFKWDTFGAPRSPYRLRGTADIGNRHSYKPGWFFIINDDGFWYYKCVFPITSSYCVQLGFGWQLDAPIFGRSIYMFSPRITRYYRA